MSRSTKILCSTVFAVVAVVGLAACGNDGDPTAVSTNVSSDSTTTTGGSTSSSETAALGDSTTITTEATTSTESTTTSTTASTTTTPPDLCPTGPDMAAGASNETAIAVDLNGDGLDDDVATYFSSGDGRWRIRVDWAGGGSIDQAVEDSDSLAPARPVGAFDVDGDGTLELFAVVGSGASSVLVGLYDVAGCNLTRVTLDGQAISFPVGASIGQISGLSCGPVGDLDWLFADLLNDGTFEGGVAPYSLAGSELTAEFGDGALLSAEEAAALSKFDCGGLQL